jgi:predicted MPP superfamily phosphohydrolase
MKEFKFRAWDEIDKKFYYFDIFESAEANHTCINNEFCLSKDLPIMLFIGLHDKNGKNIYQGDILKTENGEYEVYFYAPAYNLRDKKGQDYDNGDYYPGSDVYTHDWNQFEIVGNIYERAGWVKK